MVEGSRCLNLPEVERQSEAGAQLRQSELATVPGASCQSTQLPNLVYDTAKIQGIRMLLARCLDKRDQGH